MSNTVINTNVLSINAQRNLSKSAGMFAQSLERLSSGLRINGAKDDAAGLAIATRFTAQINGSLQAMRNTNDGLSITQTAEGSMNTIMDNLQTMRQLAVQSASDGNNELDRQALNNDLQALLSEVKRIAATTEFNGTRLLDGTTFGQVFQIGANQGQTIAFNGVDARATQIGASRVVGTEGLTAANMKAGFEVNGKMELTLSQSRGVALADSLVLDIDFDKMGGFNEAAQFNSVEITGLTSAAVASIGHGTENWGGIEMTLNGQRFDVKAAFQDANTTANNWNDINTGEDLATFLNQAVASNPTYGIQENHVPFASWENMGNGVGKLTLQTDSSVTLAAGDNGILLNTSAGTGGLQRVYTSDQITVSSVQSTTAGTSSATATVSMIDASGLGALTSTDNGIADPAEAFVLQYNSFNPDGSAKLHTFTVSNTVHQGDWTTLVTALNADTAQNLNGRFQFSGGAGDFTITDNFGRGVSTTAGAKISVDGAAGTYTDNDPANADLTITETTATIADFGPSDTFAAGTYHWLTATVNNVTVKADISASVDVNTTVGTSVEAKLQAALTAGGLANATDISVSLDAVNGVLNITDASGRAITNVSYTNPFAQTNANAVQVQLTADQINDITHIGMTVGGSAYVAPTTKEGVYTALQGISTGQDLAAYLSTGLNYGADVVVEATWDVGTSTLSVSAYNNATGQHLAIGGDLFQRGGGVGSEKLTEAGSKVNSLEDTTRVINSAIEAAIKGTEPEGVSLKTVDGKAATAEQRQEWSLANVQAGIVTLKDGSSTITVTGAFDARFDLSVSDFRAKVNDDAGTEVHFFGTNTSGNEVMSSTQVSLNEITVATREQASLAINVIDGALAMISDKRSEVGAVQRKFESALENLGIARQNMEASRSRIVDTDFAVETANLTKAQILQQAGISVLAQANASSQSVLALLQ